MNLNSNVPVNPLFNLTKAAWWMQADRGCDKVPPKGDILSLPAGGSVTVELATNQAVTSLSYGDSMRNAWPDGEDHPEDWHGPALGNGKYDCLVNNPDGFGAGMHATEHNTTSATAFAISYNSDIKDVTIENLAVFTTLKLLVQPCGKILSSADDDQAPLEANCDLPGSGDLPACPNDKCVCTWLWVPDGCKLPSPKFLII